MAEKESDDFSEEQEAILFVAEDLEAETADDFVVAAENALMAEKGPGGVWCGQGDQLADRSSLAKEVDHEAMLEDGVDGGGGDGVVAAVVDGRNVVVAAADVACGLHS